MSNRKHQPLGPNGQWKTGQRVPETGSWVDQYGLILHFDAGSTFPPCEGLDGASECAYRTKLDQAKSA